MDNGFLVRLIAEYSVIVVALLGVIALIFFVPKGHRYQAYCRVLLAGLTAYLLAKLLAITYQPTDLRPFEILGVAPGAAYLNNPGFPSDHALFVSAILFAVWAETRNKWMTISIAALVVIVCVGRVVALVHTPLDVIAGVAVAAVGALWYLQRDNMKPGKKHKHLA
jgi:membrane-associated phospholipid phosphatase